VTDPVFARPPDGWAAMSPEERRAWALQLLAELLEDEAEDEHTP
jgi:hypothetical protein